MGKLRVKLVFLDRLKRPIPLAIASILFLVAAAIFFLWIDAESAAAQCGSSASSCKNCHEVNAKHPVNGSGEWHIKHAFGDFCVFCHGGDVKAIDAPAAHKDMYYPLADIKQSCQSCHPTDTTDRAKVYAAILKVDLGAQGNTVTSGNNTASTGAKTTAQTAMKPIESVGETHATGAILDFNRRYDVEVLGIYDTSHTGNMILAGLGVVFTLGGAFLVYRFEHIGTILKNARHVPDWKVRAETSDNPLDQSTSTFDSEEEKPR